MQSLLIFNSSLFKPEFTISYLIKLSVKIKLARIHFKLQLIILKLRDSTMIFLMTFVPLLLMGCNLVWGILDFAWVARSPFRIAVVGLLTCASGFFIQTQIHHAESLPAWLVQRVPMFSVNRDVLDFLDKLVDVVIYAAGGGIVASALFLRAQLRFERERREQLQTKEYNNKKIEELERHLKFEEIDARIRGIENTPQRRDALIRILVRHEKELKKANRILEAMGE